VVLAFKPVFAEEAAKRMLAGKADPSLDPDQGKKDPSAGKTSAVLARGNPKR